jgi:preprotein translocase subunit SecD
MRRTRPISLIVIVVIALACLTATVAGKNTPHLGLDLQGGASVVLTPKNKVDSGQLNQAKAIISNRVDGLGVAEPDIHIEGNNIVVALPGVKNASRALGLVGATAELRFRPVVCVYPSGGDAAAATCGAALGITPASTDTTASTAPGDTSTTATTAPPATTSTTADLSGTTGTSQQGFGVSGGEYAAALQTPTTTATTAPTTTAPTPSTTAPGSATSTTLSATPSCGSYLTPEAKDDPNTQVVLLSAPRKDARPVCYVLGPTFLTGRAVTSASAQIPNGQWQVALHLRGGESGIDTWNAAAQKCFNSDASCPTNQLAIVLDGVVESAPQIEPDNLQSGKGFSPFDKDQISISGAFSEGEAKDLALVLRYGSLPVELVPQTVQTVSATLGNDSLHAGLAAGLVGLVLVAIYMLLYYRALGMVVVLGMAVWSALNYSIITYLSAKSGLALSLAGVTGIIVSVGVTVDSYVVYFERLKDEIHSGKTIRSSVDRGFKRAFRTIITADVSSFMGAALLYWLTIGAVRGFAFFLGLATILDVIVTWSFTRPLVAMLSRSNFFTNAKFIGMTSALGGGSATTAPAPAATPVAAPAGGR